MTGLDQATIQQTAELAKTYGPAVALLVLILIIGNVAQAWVIKSLWKQIWIIKAAGDEAVADLNKQLNANVKASNEAQIETAKRLENAADTYERIAALQARG